MNLLVTAGQVSDYIGARAVVGSLPKVDWLLAERDIIVSRETVRRWVNRFGRHFARCVRCDRPVAADKWHLDEVAIPINGVKMWLWRAVDGNGDALDILVQPRRNAKAAKRFLRQLIARFGLTRVVITPSRALLCNTLPGSGQVAQLCQTDPSFVNIT